jgi:hypothetical protein
MGTEGGERGGGDGEGWGIFLSFFSSRAKLELPVSFFWNSGPKIEIDYAVLETILT